MDPSLEPGDEGLPWQGTQVQCQEIPAQCQETGNPGGETFDLGAEWGGGGAGVVKCTQIKDLSRKERFKNEVVLLTFYFGPRK